MAILYTTHYMEEAERLCDRVGIIDGGRLIAEGTRRELVAQLGREVRIELSFTAARAPERSEAVAKAVAGVHRAHFGGDRLVVIAADGTSCMPALLSALIDASLAPSRVEVVEPDLEDVFLGLTGRALRD
jgi:ABC-2 type transport system ATP-binding protein